VVNGWQWAGCALIVLGLGGSLWTAASGALRRRLRGQNASGLVAALALLLLAQGYGRDAYQDTALLLSVLAPAGTLVFVHFFSEPDDADEGGDADADDADEGGDAGRGDARVRARQGARPREDRAGTVLTWAGAAGVVLVVIPLTVVATPGRAMAKLLLIGALTLAGWLVSSRAVADV
jgi:multisubunit Na+/H+ antiporter MnhF subunit